MEINNHVALRRVANATCTVTAYGSRHTERCITGLGLTMQLKRRSAEVHANAFVSSRIPGTGLLGVSGLRSGISSRYQVTRSASVLLG